MTGSADELARLRAALDVLPLGVVVADATGAPVLRNRLAPDPRRPADALAAGDVAELVTAALRDRRPHRRTRDLHGPPPRSLVITAEPTTASGTVNGAVAIVHDVSERRRLDAVRRDFVANVSHELRTPVGALAVLAETLAAEDDLAVARRLVERISSEAARAARIIEDLLDLSRIETEGADRRSEVPLARVLASAADRVAEAAAQCNVPVRVEQPAADAVVLVDEAQLVSALTNLLENAVKYSEPGSPVDLTVRVDAPWLVVDVRDRGVGIPTRDLKRIFERFYRVDRARSRETGGTGLGLSIVRHVAVNHGGEVSVESAEGEGSTFTLRLPVVPVGER